MGTALAQPAINHLELGVKQLALDVCSELSAAIGRLIISLEVPNPLIADLFERLHQWNRFFIRAHHTQFAHGDHAQVLAFLETYQPALATFKKTGKLPFLFSSPPKAG